MIRDHLLRRIFYTALGTALGLIFLMGCAARAPKANLDLIIESKNAEEVSYAIFHQRIPSLQFTLTRPSKDDGEIVLAVPGTYTSPRNTVEGFVVLDGKIIQNKERQGWDSAVIFKNGNAEIIQTNSGRLLTQEKLKTVASEGASLMQAHLLVIDGVAQSFKPQPPFQRRALVLFEDSSPAIIESREALDLTPFAKDLVALGVKSAVNLDMGAWSEGWYRDPDTSLPETIGLMRGATDRQTNWIIFKSRPEPLRGPDGKYDPHNQQANKRVPSID